MESGGGRGIDDATTTRPYRMVARRVAVERTREQILASAYRLWLDRRYDEVTLDAIADAAGVSRQTLLRHFGSKDALVMAVIDWRRPQEEASRRVEPGDVATAVSRLVDRYEEIGDARVRILELEGRIDAIDYVLSQARESHRQWIEHTFAPWLPAGGPERQQLVCALYAATDVTLWKLLRRDLGRSRREAEAVIRRLVDGVGAAGPSRAVAGQP
jgi:AcrR family transcriptional regulator